MKLTGFNDNSGKSGMVNSPGGGPVVALTRGILDCRKLPDNDFMALWDAIILDGTTKDRILSQAVLNFTLRPRIHRSDLPLHGIILLVGEPGTGKTSLARGLAARTAEILKTLGTFLYLEVEPHALASAALGKRQKAPSVSLADVEKALIKEYGKDNVSCQRRSATVNFGVVEVDCETNDQVMSFDVVPAFTKGDHYEIPDTAVFSGWTETNPRIHAEKAVDAQKAYAGEWKGLVRMMKAWNRQQGKPVKPSFLLEVMALEILPPPFGGDYRREIQAFFASTAARIGETWPDPAGLGPPVSDSMDAPQCVLARQALLEAEKQAANAIRLEREGKNGEALRAWRDLFGPLFPLS